MSKPRQTAKAAGLLTYAALSACSYGHLGTRWTDNTRCTRCYPRIGPTEQPLLDAIERDSRLLSTTLRRIRLGVPVGFQNWPQLSIAYICVYLTDKYNLHRSHLEDLEDD